MSSGAQVRAVLTRELSLEVASREALAVVPSFVLASVLLAGLGFGPRPDVLAAVAPGLPWLVVLFAAAPLARLVAAVERDEGCWDLLRTLVRPGALLCGKVTALWLALAATWGLAAGLGAGVANSALTAGGLLAGGLGTLGLAAVTATFGALLAGTGRRVGLLSSLLLPAGLPALLAGTQAATMGVDPRPWIALLLAYDVVMLAVAWAVFPVVLEE